MRTRLILGLILVTFSAVLFAPAMAQQQKDPMMHKDRMNDKAAMEMKNMPGPVMDAFKKAYPDASIDRAWTEKQAGGMTVYDIKTMQGDKPMIMVYDEEGKMIETREMIEPTALPADVTNAVKKSYPDCSMERAEKIMRGNTVEYGVMFHQNGDAYSAVYTPQGKMVSNEKAGMGMPKTEPIKGKPTGY